jgi:hypothetical protein
MRVPHFSSVWQAEQSERAREQRAGGLVRLTALAASLVGSMLLSWGGAQAVAACPGACGTQATATGLATPPAWAVGRHIHFFASPKARSGLTKATVAPRKRGQLGRRCETGYCPEPPLLYKESGKGVQHTPKVFVIFWGKKWTVAPGSELRTQLLKFYEGLSGSAYQGILTQYFDATGRISSSVTVTSYTDETVSAPTSVNDAALQGEVSSAVSVKKWTREFNDQFVVIPAPGSTYESGFDTGFCGYHGITTTGESSYTFVPYIGNAPFYEGCAGFDAAKNVNHVTSMIAAHEYAESATDPTPSGTNATWQTSNEYEIGDICASGDDELPNGSWVQGLWDDHQSACSLSDKEPPHVYAVTNLTSNRSYSEADLHGVVNPEGLETKYHFEYGTTTSYGSNTSEASAGAGVKNVPVEQLAKGLQAYSTYHYRLVATNSTGTTYGMDQEFGTPKPYWSIQSTPNPSEATHSVLRGDSCTSSSACTAVGQYATTTMSLQALAEVWNGTSWAVKTVPNPTGATQSALGGVSCTSSSTCTAVGWYSNSAGTIVTLAEAWNGTSWSVQTTPNPSEATSSYLNGVSCTSSSACVAVGEYQHHTGMSSTTYAFAEVWNGTSWTVKSVPNPAETTDSALSGVSCTSSSACTAVGSYNNFTLAEAWNGTSWSVQTTPNPAEAAASSLRGVSCTSTSACVAVGEYQHHSGMSSTTYAFAEVWNGTSWTVKSVPNPAETTASALSGVSCTSSSACTAVGSYSSSILGILAELWNGASWVYQLPTTEPGPHVTSSKLLGVSCWSTAVCEGAGKYTEPVEVGGQKIQEEFTLAELDS